MARRLRVNDSSLPPLPPPTLPSASAGGGLAHLVTPSGERYVRKERSADDYKSHTLHTHIYSTPDTYVGSAVNKARHEFVLDWVNAKLTQTNVEIAEAVVRCYLEILSNAGDNADATRRMGRDVGTITVTMDRKCIVIRSEGEPIPVVPKEDISTEPTPGDPGRCLTLVDFIFGVLLTSSNYDKNVIRMGCGKNGYGAKLVNVFSHRFQVKVGDPYRLANPDDPSQGYRGGHEHISVWQGNMTRHTTSTTMPGFIHGPRSDGTVGWGTAPGTPYTGPAYVEVSWDLDFARFDCRQTPGGEYGYPDEAFGLFARYLADFGLTCKVPVSFNGVEIDVRNVRDYGAMYFTPEQCATAVSHYEWDTKDGEPPECLKRLKAAAREKLIAQCPTADCIPQIEMYVFDTPDSARVLSFVNGLMTIDGGVHVNEAYNVIAKEVLEQINKIGARSAGSKKRGEKKGESAKKNEAKIPHLTPSDVKPHVSVILVCRLPDPAYTSQSKTQLTQPKPKLTLADNFFTGMGKWQLAERLMAALEAKMFKTLAKTDGKKRQHISLDRGEDAGDAGTSNSHECILYIVEGKSASSYPKKRIVMTPGGKIKSGYFPLKGKPLNVTDAPIDQIAGNEEINAVKKLMGFREGVDYKEPSMRATLRYGFLMGCMDADSDGKHIIALWINTLYRRWPSILELGLFGFLVTPVVRLFSDRALTKCVARFYSTKDFEEYVRKNPNHGCHPKYYKGLGTSRDSDIRDDLSSAPMVICVYDDRAGAALDLAFRRKQADARKLWIQRWRQVAHVEDVVAISASSLLQHRSIHNIINHDLIDYTVDALFRAIPSFNDGLKKSQRQALHYLLHEYKYGHSHGKPTKVSDLASGASKFNSYHHGPKSMMDTMINMAQDFIGSNNLNVLKQEGQFGTRDDGGDDAADGRYSETCPEWWLKYVYSEELTKMVPCRMVEGEPKEPVWLPCEIPVHVINGAAGVATGHSTFLPAHNPYDVIRWLMQRCEGVEKPTALIPWYRGFRGTIEVVKPGDVTPPGGAPLPEVKVPTPRHSRLLVKDAAPLMAPLPPRPSRLQIKGEEKAEEREEDEPADEDEIKEGASALVALEGTAKGRGISMKTLGSFTITGTKGDDRVNLVITELPIGRWLHPYRKWLESLLEQKKIDHFIDNSTTEVPHYTVIGFQNLKGATHETLRLQKSYGLSNITLLDDEGYPYRFTDVQQVMETYYQAMINLFAQVVAKRVANAEADVTDANYSLQLITAVVHGRILIFKDGRSLGKAKIYEQMDELKIPHKYLNGVKLIDLSEEEIAACQVTLEKKIKMLEEMRRLTPQAVWIDRLRDFEAALRSHRYE